MVPFVIALMKWQGFKFSVAVLFLLLLPNAASPSETQHLSIIMFAIV